MNESSVERQDQEYISDSSASHASGVSVLAAIDRTVSMYSKDTKDYLEATGNTVSNSKCDGIGKSILANKHSTI